jgi:hypothetical protein
MRSLAAAELLNAWEQGLPWPPFQRALLLLEAALPDVSPDALADLSIGQRDAYLLALRERLFGKELVGVATCPNCGDSLELNFTTADIRVPMQDDPALLLEAEGYRVHFRLPTSCDLAALASDSGAAQDRLLARCILEATQDGTFQRPDMLPEEVQRRVIDEMARADAQADIQLDVTCPACGHTWHAAFDVLSFLWAEVHAWALRILREVHLLASAYGWSEADILAMSALRRQWYIQMAGL